VDGRPACGQPAAEVSYRRARQADAATFEPPPEPEPVEEDGELVELVEEDDDELLDESEDEEDEDEDEVEEELSDFPAPARLSVR
jgi:hypothetical protein